MPETAPATRAGRPRRFESEDELRILLDAALVVMERNGYVDAAVADILREADLSTRSFYRHFESKDQLLCALFRREAEAAAARLRAKVDAAANPREALDAWIDEILSFGHHRAKAARVSVLGSPGAMRAEGYAEEMRHATAVLTAPLEALLRDGCGRRLVPPGRPGRRRAADSVGRLGGGGPHPARDKPSSRAEAARQVRSFCERALGVTPPTSLTRSSLRRRLNVRGWRAPSATTGPARRPRPAPRRRSRARAGARRPRPPRPGA